MITCFHLTQAVKKPKKNLVPSETGEDLLGHCQFSHEIFSLSYSRVNCASCISSYTHFDYTHHMTHMSISLPCRVLEEEEEA